MTAPTYSDGFIHRRSTPAMFANMRKQGRGRSKFKLSDDDVREIRKMIAGGMLFKDIAALKGVSPPTIADINGGRTHWRVKDEPESQEGE